MNFQHSGRCCFIAGVLAIGIAGCTEEGQRQVGDPGRVSQIQRGITTRSQIQALFGNPQHTSYNEDGGESWSYSHLLIPPTAYILGPFGGNSFMQSSHLSIEFDKAGVVKAYSTSGS
jgi:outer membrane protein assembly factor BamE (lipoprotein component of BamABCDE complex)